MKEAVLMSAYARDCAYIVKTKKDAKPVPVMSKEKLAQIKAEAKKYRLVKQ